MDHSVENDFQIGGVVLEFFELLSIDETDLKIVQMGTTVFIDTDPSKKNGFGLGNPAMSVYFFCTVTGKLSKPGDRPVLSVVPPTTPCSHPSLSSCLQEAANGYTMETARFCPRSFVSEKKRAAPQTWAKER